MADILKSKCERRVYSYIKFNSMTLKSYKAINIFSLTKDSVFLFFNKILLTMILSNKGTIFNQPCLIFADDLYEKNLPTTTTNKKHQKILFTEEIYGC